MDSLSFAFQTAVSSNLNSVRRPEIYSKTPTIAGFPAGNVHLTYQLNNRCLISVQRRCSFSGDTGSVAKEEEEEEEEVEGSVEEATVPKEWLNPEKALEESEWLRVTLHKWLDDEYCPEPTNVDISNVAARSFYKSLTENQTDLGDILLRMAMELESVSYKESFHGAFSSANAAISLILERIVHE